MGIIFILWVGGSHFRIWKEQGGLVEGALWVYNFWSLFPFLLMSTGVTISGVFGIIASAKRLRGEDAEIVNLM